MPDRFLASAFRAAGACSCLLGVGLGRHLASAATAPAAAAEPAPYEWQAGAVFRDYTYNGDPDNPEPGAKPHPHHISEVDPGSKRENIGDRVANTRLPRPLTLTVAGAERAEFIPEYWGGHIGTTAWFAVNKRSWSPWPRPFGTPESPEHYYHTVLGGRAAPIRLTDLVEGENTFRIAAGPQTYGSFDWGFFWIYAFTVRVYHTRTPDHPSAAIANLKSGDTIGENVSVTVAPMPGKAPIKRVDVFAYYEDFNWSGSGFHREWHAQTLYGRPSHHVGSATAAPWTVRWNTEWVPDQTQPVRLVARVIDEAGWQTISPIVANLNFRRTGRSVQLVRATDMPKAFGVRVGREASCNLEVPALPRMPSRARIMLLSWSGAHVERVRLNDTPLSPKIGRVHDFAVDAIEVPVTAVKPGRNVFAMFSETKEHAAEVDWPGPVLLLEFAGK